MLTAFKSAFEAVDRPWLGTGFAFLAVGINVPLNYYPDDNPAKPPLNRWRSHAHLLYGNWINEIYQSTPYEIDRIGT